MRYLALLLLVFISGCSSLISAPEENPYAHIRSCGTLISNGPADENYVTVFNCMADRLLACAKGHYEVQNQFDFYITGVSDDGESCNFYMEYKSREEMGDSLSTHMYAKADLEKTCSLRRKQILTFEALNPIPENRDNIFKTAFFEMAFGITDHCEGSMVEAFSD